MIIRKKGIITVFVLLVLGACNDQQSGTGDDTGEASAVASETKTPGVSLAEPYATKSTKNFSKVIGWPNDKTPSAPAGFKVSKFAGSMDNPRWIYIAPNGDVLVAEDNTEKEGFKKIKDKITGQDAPGNLADSGSRIVLLRDKNKDGTVDLRTTFLTGLNKPFGMLILGSSFYVATTDGLWRYPYEPGQTSMPRKGNQLLQLPAGGYNLHWTRNLIANRDGSKIYIAIGSGSNVGENGMEYEGRRANIIEINPDGSGERIYASGMRNPVGMGWAPGTNVLWVTVNERDELGDELVPDYLTGVKEGGFYGWPYAYFGQHEDPRRKGENPEMVRKALVPDLALGSHTTPLGLAFYEHKAFPPKYQNGAFIGQHGSWNHSRLVGYKVVFVPFQNGKPTGEVQDFLTGFIANREKAEVHGRPVGVAVAPDGALLVADDAGGAIWRIQVNN